ncbi:uncharacterized protein LOC144104688 [Amblyomma americanum]
MESRRDESERSGASKRQDLPTDDAAASKPGPDAAENTGTASLVVREEAKKSELSTDQRSQSQPPRAEESRSRQAPKAHESQQQPQKHGQQGSTKLPHQQESPQRPTQPKQRGASSPVGEFSLYPSPAAILVVFLFTVGGVALSIVAFKSFPRPQYRCLKSACHGVLEYMDAIVDKRVNPCHNFYRHVCGRWLSNATAPAPSSFMADVLRNYTARRHQMMMARLSGSQPADMVSRYYGTCVAYLGVPRTVRDIVNKVLEVSGTTIKSWLNMTSEQAFFKLLQLSFLFRLHALFRLTAGIIESKVYLGIDRANSFKQRLPSAGRHTHGKSYLTTALKAIGDEDINDTIIAPCLALDDTIGFNETLRQVLRSPLTPTSEADCAEFPPTKWIEGTNSQNMKLPAEEVNVLARNFKATCNNLKLVLMHKMPSVKTFYIVALLAVDFLKLDFTRTATSKQLEAESVQRICHHDTVNTFKRLWLPALSEVLSISPTTVEAISGYFSTTQHVIDEEGAAYPKWMNVKDRITALDKARHMSIVTLNIGNVSKEEVDHSRFNPSFGMNNNDWVYNKANVLRRTHIPDDVDEDSTIPEDEEYTQNVEVQLLANSTTNTVVVPHMFAVHPVFFDDISAGSYANVAMLGFHIARKVMALLIGLRESSPWSNDSASYYATARSCYANSSRAFHGVLSDAKFDEAVAAALALRVVFRVGPLVAEGATKSDAPFFSKELFFRRACLSLCAGGRPHADFNSVDQDTASAACTLAVSTMAEFHKTFGCSSSDQMAVPGRCKF